MPAAIRTKSLGPPKHKKKIDPGAVVAQLATNPKGIDSGSMLAEFIACFGGAQNFAREVYAEYEDAKPGTIVRTKIIEMIARLTQVVTAQELARPRRAEDMDDEELKDAATKLIGRMNNDAAPTDPAAA